MLPLDIDLFPAIPEETRYAGVYVFGKKNFYIAVGDQVNTLFNGLTLIDLIPGGHTPVRTLAMLNLITVFQYLETIPDLWVSDALGKRVDWKYALHLPLHDTGSEASAVCPFRKGLWGDRDSLMNMGLLLSRLSAIVWQTRRQHLPSEATVVIQRVCLLSRVAIVWEAMSEALEILAIDHPEWLSNITPPHWYQRYSQRQNAIILASSRKEQEDFAVAIGADGVHLLNTIRDSQDANLTELSAVAALKKVWSEQYDQEESLLFWKREGCIGCNLSIHHSNPLESPDHFKEEGKLN